MDDFQRMKWGVVFCIIVSSLSFAAASFAAQVTGELNQWHRVEVTADGPQVAESDSASPFLRYRMTVQFTAPSGKKWQIPGHFAGDGNAAESGVSGGRVWRAFLSPNEVGAWSYSISFREGENAAITSDSGTPVRPDGESGQFQVAPSDKSGPDFRAYGKLAYDGGRYLRFEGNKKPWIKAGADSPENFLAFYQIDGTKKGNRELHRFAPHTKDWNAGDPSWKGGSGKGIIGAVNYLASKGMNSIYFLTMNVNGDGNDVWPWTSANAYSKFDLSKLDQWEIVFSHMEKKGVLMHVVLQEMENSNLLDGGNLGNNRKLYYRELISRFSHHNGIVWLLGEEVQNSTAQLTSFGDYIHAVDAYQHIVEVHTGPKSKDKIFTPLLGKQAVQAASLQNAMSGIYELTQQWLNASSKSGRPWLVFYDEQNPPKTGIAPDSDKAWKAMRTQALWPHLMAGGSGVEWYFGSSSANNDLGTEDWRSRAQSWTQTDYAIRFFQDNLPFDQMQSSSSLSAGNWTLYKVGQVYAVYTKNAGAGVKLDLSGASGKFDVQWFNAEKGGALSAGSVREVSGGALQSVGAASGFSGDGVVLVKKR